MYVLAINKIGTINTTSSLNVYSVFVSRSKKQNRLVQTLNVQHLLDIHTRAQIRKRDAEQQQRGTCAVGSIFTLWKWDPNTRQR